MVMDPSAAASRWTRWRAVTLVIAAAAAASLVLGAFGTDVAQATKTEEILVEMTQEQVEEAMYAAEVSPYLTLPQESENSAPGEASGVMKIIDLELAVQAQEIEPLSESERPEVETVLTEVTEQTREQIEENDGSEDERAAVFTTVGEYLEHSRMSLEAIERIKEKAERAGEKAKQAAAEILEKASQQQNKNVLRRVDGSTFLPNWQQQPAQDGAMQTLPTLKKVQQQATSSPAVQNLDSNIISPPGPEPIAPTRPGLDGQALNSTASPALEDEIASLGAGTGGSCGLSAAPPAVHADGDGLPAPACLRTPVQDVEASNTTATDAVTTAAEDAGSNVQNVVTATTPAQIADAKAAIQTDANTLKNDAQAQDFSASALKDSRLPAGVSSAAGAADDGTRTAAAISTDAATDVATDAIDPLMITQLLTQGPQIILTLINLVEGTPTSEEVILEQIKGVREMITALSKQVQSGFTSVESNLKQLDEKLEYSVELLKEANLNIGRIRDELGQVEDGLDTIQADLYTIAATQRQEIFQTTLNTDIGYSTRTPGGQTLPLYQFEQGIGLFYTWGFDDPFNAISEKPEIDWPTSPKEVQGDLTTASGCAAENQPGATELSTGNCLNFNLDYLANYANAHGWVGGTPLQEHLPNPEVWAAGGTALAQLLTENPEDVTKPVLNELTAVKNVGTELQTELRRFAKSGPRLKFGEVELETGSGLLNHALQNYLEEGAARGGLKEPSLLDRLEAEENKLLSADKRGEENDELCNAPPVGLGSCQLAKAPKPAGNSEDEGVPYISLWGGPEQTPQAPLPELESTAGDPSLKTRKPAKVGTIEPCEGSYAKLKGQGKTPDEVLPIKAGDKALEDPLPAVYANAWHLGLGRIGVCYEDVLGGITAGGPAGDVPGRPLTVALDWYWYDNETAEAAVAMRVMIEEIWIEGQCPAKAPELVANLWKNGQTGLSECFPNRWSGGETRSAGLEADLKEAVEHAKGYIGTGLAKTGCEPYGGGPETIVQRIYSFETLKCEVTYPSPEAAPAKAQTRSNCEADFTTSPAGLTGEVTRELECLQKEAYASIAPTGGEQLNGAGEEPQKAAERLAGARTLLDDYVDLALPRAVSTDAQLRSLLSGPGHLLDNTPPDSEVWRYFHREAEATGQELPEADPAGPDGLIEADMVTEGADALAVRLRNALTASKVSESGHRGQSDPLISSTIARLGLAEAELEPLVGEAVPLNTKAPEILGKLTVGSTLKCTEGEWTGEPTPVPHYEWIHEGSTSPLGTGPTYVVKQSDVKSKLQCIVTEQNENGEASAASKALLVPVVASLLAEDLLGGQAEAHEPLDATVKPEIIVHNTGNVKLAISIESFTGCEAAPSGGKSTLEPGEATTYSCKMDLKYYGKYTSQVWVKGTPGVNEGLPLERPSNDLELTVIPPEPVVVTEGTVFVRALTATLKGSVNPNGSAFVEECFFVYGKNTGYGSTIYCSPGTLAPGTSPVQVSGKLPTGLEEKTVYHFKICARNKYGTECGEDMTFETTESFTPFVETTEATSITGTTAQINGVIDPYGEHLVGTCGFEWGTTTKYGNAVPCPTSVYENEGNAPLNVTAVLKNLAAGVTYHYRLIAGNVNGEAKGVDEKFETTPPKPPTVTMEPVAEYNQSEAKLEGSVTANGSAISSCVFVAQPLDVLLPAKTKECTTTSGPGGSSRETATLTGLAGGYLAHLQVIYTNIKVTKATTASSSVVVFSTRSPLAAATKAAQEVGAHTAELEGSVTPNGLTVATGECKFVVHPPAGANTEVPCEPLPITGTTTQAISAPATKLTENVKYSFWIVAKDAGGDQVESPHATFTTVKEGPPEVTINPPGTRNVTQTGGEVYAEVNPHGLPTTCKVSYAVPSASSSTEVPCASPSSGTGGVSREVSANLEGLEPGTVYDATFKVKNAKGEKLSTPIVLKTEGQPVIAFHNGKGEILPTGTKVRMTPTVELNTYGSAPQQIFLCNASEFKGSIVTDDAGEIEIEVTEMILRRGHSTSDSCYSGFGEINWGGGAVTVANEPWTLKYKEASPPQVTAELSAPELEEFTATYPSGGPEGSPGTCTYERTQPIVGEVIREDPGYFEFSENTAFQASLSSTIGCPTEEPKAFIDLGYMEANGEGVSIN
jgi:hypothetical protein